MEAQFRSNTVKNTMYVERLRNEDGTIQTVRPVSLDLSVFRRHIADMSRLITHSKLMSEISPVMHDPRVREGITKVVGEKGYEALVGAFQHTARPNAVSKESLQPSWRAINWIRKKGGAAALTPRVSTAVKQALSAFNAISEMKKFSPDAGKHYAGALAEFISGNRNVSDIVDQIDKWDDLMLSRGNNLDQNMTDLINDARAELPVGVKIPGTNRFLRLKDIQDGMYYGVRAVDSFTTYPVWLAAYNMAILDKVGGVKEGMTDEEKHNAAVAFARRLVSRTQPTSVPFAMTDIQRSQFMKPFTSFMTFLLGVHGQRVYNTLKARQKGKISNKDLIRIVALEGLAPVYAQLLVQLLYYNDDKKPDWTEFVIQPASYLLTSHTPLARDFVSFTKYGKAEAFPGLATAFKRIWYPLEKTYDLDLGGAMYEWGKTAGWITGLNILNFSDDFGKMYENYTGKSIWEE